MFEGKLTVHITKNTVEKGAKSMKQTKQANKIKNSIFCRIRGHNSGQTLAIRITIKIEQGIIASHILSVWLRLLKKCGFCSINKFKNSIFCQIRGHNSSNTGAFQPKIYLERDLMSVHICSKLD